jgi:hypothetical protein
MFKMEVVRLSYFVLLSHLDGEREAANRATKEHETTRLLEAMV